MLFRFPLLPLIVIAATLVLALVGLFLAEAGRREQRWFPWAFLPLVLLPELLGALDLGFMGMLTIYSAWPAGMGPLALVYNALHRRLIWNELFFWLLAVGLAAAWLGLVRWLWLRWPRMAYLLWLLGLVIPGASLYVWLLPVD